MVWAKIIVGYFFVGTLFLMLFMSGRLHLDMVNKKTGEKLEDVDIFILSFCLYWPLLVLMLMLNLKRGEDDDDRDD